MECQNCGAYNDDGEKVCAVCGRALPAAPQKPVRPEKPEKAEKPKRAAVAAVETPPLPPVVVQPPEPQTIYQPVPVARASLTWGPFAGYGQRLTYGGWVIEGESVRAHALFTSLENRFRERYSPAAEVFVKAFTGAGQQAEVEARNYLLFRRGQATIALNIVPFGSDIFISSAAFIKAPLSRLKLGLLALAILLSGEFFLIFPAWAAEWAFNIQSSGLPALLTRASNIFNLLFYLCLLAPLGLAALVLTLATLFKALLAWVNRADFGAPLRMAANEFQQDDLLALNRSVEQTLRAALKECGLSPTSLARIFPGPLEK